MNSTITATTQRIAQLNDALLRSLVGGQVMLTQSIATLPSQERQSLIHQVKIYDHFTPNNDPYGEHDMGRFDVNGTPYLWKIDYYDKTNRFRSEDPSNPLVTNRVLTIMQASDY